MIDIQLYLHLLKCQQMSLQLQYNYKSPDEREKRKHVFFSQQCIALDKTLISK